MADLTTRARNALRGAGPQGPIGPQGPTGPQGVQGIQGPAGAVSGTTTRINSVTLANGASNNVTAQCQAGETLVGGGARLGNTDVGHE